MNTSLHQGATSFLAALLLSSLSLLVTPAYAADATQQVPTNEKPHGQSPGQAPASSASQQKQKDEGRTDDNSQVQSQERKDKQHREQENNTKTKGTTPSAY